jgi:hypothetical protein
MIFIDNAPRETLVEFIQDNVEPALTARFPHGTQSLATEEIRDIMRDWIAENPDF